MPTISTKPADQRLNMVASQIRPSNVRDQRVIAAMASIPRENFVPKAKKGVAYVDHDIEIKPGRYLMEPRVLAKLTDAAEIQDSDFVLEIGPGTGYSTAVLAALSEAVVALEEDPELTEKATAMLEKLGIDNVAVISGKHNEGVPSQAPYQVIFINGAVERVPEALLEQLEDGGRLACVMLENGVGHARLYTKFHGDVGSRRLFDANVEPLPGFKAEQEFVF